MRTKMFWLVIAVAAVLTGLTSCQKEEPELIINSEVLESGIGKDITDKSITNPDGTKGTALSYESWIMLKVETRASSDRKVSVTLNNLFNNVEAKIYTDKFTFGKPSFSVSYKSTKSNKDWYVDVVDSVMVYTVKFDEFSFDYELLFQVPTYNDGITKQRMPYYRIEKIKDNGYTVSEVDYIIVDNKSVYARMILKYSIIVVVNGKEYPVEATITLLLLMGNDGPKTAVKSELIDSGISDQNESGPWMQYTSWIKLKQTCFDGTTKETSYSLTKELYGFFESEMLKYQYWPDDKVIKKSSNIVLRGNKVVSSANNVKVICIEQDYIVEYNYVTIKFPVTHYEAEYFDGLAKIIFPSYKHENIVDDGQLIYTGSYTENGLEYDEYWFNQKLTAKFGTMTQEALRNFQVIIQKK